MDPRLEHELMLTRRQLFGKAATGIGVAALYSLLGAEAGATGLGPGNTFKGVLKAPHFPPKIKRVIYLFQSGAPSQIELFDPKPKLAEIRGQDLPASIRMGQRITGMTSGQKTLPVVNSIFGYKKYGKCGMEMSELLPHIGSIADKITLVRTMHTEAINHDPAFTFIQTGSQQPGRPSIGSWVSYGLGSEADDLPGYVVLISQGTGRRSDQPLFGRLWGPGFLPSVHQGVKLRSGGEPVLYLKDPDGIDSMGRREMLDALAKLNASAFKGSLDPEINTRISQYEMAYRMQTSVPELMDLSKETAETFELYGPNSKTPGTFAANCLLARRLAERGVRFIQLFHKGWDMHDNLPNGMKGQTSDIDQPSAALIKDLERRGMLDETLVVWGGEFGRTVYSQGELTATNYGRDHHGRNYSIWMAGGGVKEGYVHGVTDDFSYNILEGGVHIHDLNATVLHQFGVDHTRLTYNYQGRDFRLTDVEGEVAEALLK